MFFRPALRRMAPTASFRHSRREKGNWCSSRRPSSQFDDIAACDAQCLVCQRFEIMLAIPDEYTATQLLERHHTTDSDPMIRRRVPGENRRRRSVCPKGKLAKPAAGVASMSRSWNF